MSTSALRVIMNRSGTGLPLVNDAIMAPESGHDWISTSTALASAL
jgi:hypothetical protein